MFVASIDSDYALYMNFISDSTQGSFVKYQSVHAKFDIADLNQRWALTTNSPTEHFFSGDSVIIGDFVVFAGMNVANVFDQVRNSYVVKQSRADGAVVFHKEYKHGQHDTCVGQLSTYSKLTLVRDSFSNVFVGQMTALLVELAPIC